MLGFQVLLLMRKEMLLQWMAGNTSCQQNGFKHCHRKGSNSSGWNVSQQGLWPGCRADLPGFNWWLAQYMDGWGLLCLLASAWENTKSKHFLVGERFLHIFVTEQIRGQQGKKTFLIFINHAVMHLSLENTRRIQFSCTYSISFLACGQSPQIKMEDLEKTESGYQDKTSKKSVTQKHGVCGLWSQHRTV